jgi:threonine/homoserine/homoserine lactone efflux protein
MLERPDLIIPFLLFSIVSFYTPGPNNLMLLTSGLTFGFKRTGPAMLGVACGFAFLTLCVGLGLGALFIDHPLLYNIIKYGGAAYMLYLAWKIANSEPPNPETMSQQKQPVRFLQAVALQWVNPKGWAMAVSAVAGYAPLAAYPYNIMLMGFCFVLIGITSSIAWAGLGLALQRFLHKPKIVRAFNIIMAMLLAASLYPVLFEHNH